MEIILPKKIEEYEKKLDVSSFDKCRNSMSPTKVNFYLPKFKIEASGSTSLVPLLKSMGLKDCFTEGANFSFMDTNNSITISDVIHKAMIEVNEEGAEAAAATAVVLRAKLSVMKKQTVMHCSSPFLYSITHLPSSTSIFLGKITCPRY